MSEGRYVRIRRPDGEYSFELDQDNSELTLAITSPSETAMRKLTPLIFEDSETQALYRLLESLLGEDDDQ